jgi:hypothetical protein
MKNAVLWDIKPQFIPHRRHITSLLQSQASSCYVKIAIFTAVTMKNAVLWDIKPQFVPHRRHIPKREALKSGLAYGVSEEPSGVSLGQPLTFTVQAGNFSERSVIACVVPHA